MAIFSPKSRYALFARTGVTFDRRGRETVYVGPAHVPDQFILGEHRKKDHQRLDHIAHHYLDDPAAFWRLCEANDAIVPDALARRSILAIPTKKAGR